MEASTEQKPDSKEGAINKFDVLPETEEGQEDEQEETVADEPEVKTTEDEEARLRAEAELEKLESLTEVVSIILGKPPEQGGQENEFSIYLQQPLGYIATLRFYSLVGKNVAESVKKGGVVDLGDAFTNTNGNVQDRAKQIIEQSFNDAGSFAALLAQLVAYSPDFILDFYCLALDIPTAERRWAKAVMEQPW